jgi:hypothetical protein
MEPIHESDLEPPIITDALSLEDVLRPHSSARERLGQTALAGLALIIVLVLAVRVAVPTTNTIIVYRSTVPTPGANTGDFNGTFVRKDAIYLATNINYGWSLNGRPLSLATNDVVPLAPGENLLRMAGVPFTPFSCQIAWPFAYGNQRCQGNGTVNLSGVAGPLASINAFVTFDDLPAAQQRAFATFITNTLATSLPAPLRVAPGEFTLTNDAATQGMPLVSQTTAPLGAQPLVTQIAQRYCQEAICVQPVFMPDFQASGAGIAFRIPIDVGWRFTTPSGSQRDLWLTTAAQPVFLDPLVFAYSTERGWWTWTDGDPQQLIAQEIGGDFCQVGINALTQALPTQTVILTQYPNPVAGCLLAVQDGQEPRGAADVLGTFAERYGALLAVDAGAHTLLPQLPIAPPAEVAAIHAAGG